MAGNEEAEFEEVLKDELKLLNELRDNSTESDKKSVYDRAFDFNLAGLAFSGGGIRSATFNLGVIQALAKYGLLSKFDYLSTVSGGGFIGGWLSALLQRKAGNKKVDQKFVEGVQQYLKPHPVENKAHTYDKTVGFAPVEHKAVRYLRRYSNYISPTLGLSGDMLALVSIFLRNFTLIQLALISLVVSILLLAHVVGAASQYTASGWLDFLGPFLSDLWGFVGATLALMVAVWFAGRLIANRKTHHDNPAATASAVHIGIIFPCLFSAWLFSAAVATHFGMTLDDANFMSHLWIWVVVAGVAYAAAWALGLAAARSMPDGKPDKDQTADGSLVKVTLVSSAILTGGLFGLLLYVIVHHLDKISVSAPLDIWHMVTYGPPVFLLVLAFVVTLHIGAVRRRFSEQDREWLARVGGFILLYTVAWLLAFCLLLYATPFVYWLAGGGLAVLAAWAGGSGVGAWFARGPSTGEGQEKSVWKDMTAKIAPWLFIAGLVVILTYVTQLVLFKYFIDTLHMPEISADFRIAAAATLMRLNALPLPGALVAMLIMGLLFYVISRRLDINLFSLHGMYCNRLARAYLGASRAGEREPNPFTGFDSKDDLPFSQLEKQRPIPIINTAINMTGGDDLAWQTRRAASFAFTPNWAGFETRSTQGFKIGKYRPTNRYAGGRYLGTLIAISGAAASPNMGYHTSPSVAALLTAFNLRLGRWCGNPMRETWDKISPEFAATPIFAELTGSATAQADWINLTDGGHFENLGVYELVRRRCRLIVVTDAGCDPKYEYDDLANLLRLCWTDLGVNIRFENFNPMHPPKDSRYIDAHAMVGEIEYGDPAINGVMIYIKSSMTGNEWPDIRQYADAHKDFPHQTTADQFFDENQFEAYRHLGYKVIATMLKDLGGYLHKDVKTMPVGNFVDSLLSSKLIVKT